MNDKVHDIIDEVMQRMTTQYEGKEPRDDVVLVAEIMRLREQLEALHSDRRRLRQALENLTREAVADAGKREVSVPLIIAIALAEETLEEVH